MVLIVPITKIKEGRRLNLISSFRPQIGNSRLIAYLLKDSSIARLSNLAKLGTRKNKQKKKKQLKVVRCKIAQMCFELFILTNNVLFERNIILRKVVNKKFLLKFYFLFKTVKLLNSSKYNRILVISVSLMPVLKSPS